MNKSRNWKNSKKDRKIVKEEPRKDSSSKRVNFDNARIDDVTKLLNDAARKMGKSNDVSWYALNAQMLRSAGSVSFSNVVSEKLPFSIPGQTTTSYNRLSSQFVPFAMNVHWTPAFGGENSTVLEAAKQGYYSFVVHANSRNESYTADDLMLVTIAAAEIFGAIGATSRAYGVLKSPTNAWNAGFPLGLVYGMGFDAEDFRNNLHDIWFTVNNWIAQSAQIWIPNNLPFVKRWFWLNSNIYMDANSPKAQYYQFVQEMYHVYSDTASSTGGSLVPMRTANNSGVWTSQSAKTSWADWKQMIQSMIDSLIGSLDRGLIMGDILKAYGADKIYALSEIPADYSVIPVYDAEVLTQIENSVSISIAPWGLVQEQSSGMLKTAWKLVPSTPYHNSNQTVLNFHQLEQPTPEQVMVATRLAVNSVTSRKAYSITWDATKAAWEFQSEVLNKIPDTCGTEVVNFYSIIENTYEFTPSTGVAISKLYDRHYFNQHQEVTIATSSANAYHRLALEELVRWTAFDWAPWIYVYDANNTETETGVYNTARRVLGDFDMYSVLSSEQLNSLHLTAIYSEWGIPTL